MPLFVLIRISCTPPGCKETPSQDIPLKELDTFHNAIRLAAIFPLAVTVVIIFSSGLIRVRFFRYVFVLN